MLIKEFLDKVSNQIKCKSIVKDIEDELLLHINEQKENYISEGMNVVEAEEKAVANMGDGEEIGKKLNKVHKPRLDIGTLVLTLLLISAGIMVAVVKAQRLESYCFLVRMIISIFVGLAIGICIYFYDYRKLKKYSVAMYIFATILNIWTIVFGYNIGGMKETRFMGLRVSPLYISTYLYIISFIGFLTNSNSENNLKFNILKKEFFINLDFLKNVFLTIISILFIKQIGNISMLLLLIICYIILTFIYIVNSKSDIKKKLIKFTAFLVILFVIALIIFGSNIQFYNRQILNNGKLDPNGNGWQNLKIKDVLENSHLFSGLEDMEDYFGLFDGGTITALVTITAYYGSFFSMITIIAVTLLAIKLIYNAKQIKELYGKMLIVGFSSIILLQSLVNILVNLNILRVVNVALPFVSYGVNGLLINMIALGVILSVYRRKDINLGDIKENRKKLKIKISYE